MCHSTPQWQFLFAKCSIGIDTAVPVADQPNSAAHLQPHAAPGARNNGTDVHVHGDRTEQCTTTIVVGVGGGDGFVGVDVGGVGGGAHRQCNDIQAGAQLNRSPVGVASAAAGARVGASGLVASRLIAVVAVVASFPAAAAAATAAVVVAVAAAVLVIVVAVVALIFRLVQVAELIQHDDLVVVVDVVTVVAGVVVVVAQPIDQDHKETQSSRHERGHNQLSVILNAPIPQSSVIIPHPHSPMSLHLQTYKANMYLVCYLYI